MKIHKMGYGRHGNRKRGKKIQGRDNEARGNKKTGEEGMKIQKRVKEAYK